MREVNSNLEAVPVSQCRLEIANHYLFAACNAYVREICNYVTVRWKFGELNGIRECVRYQCAISNRWIGVDENHG